MRKIWKAAIVRRATAQVEHVYTDGVCTGMREVVSIALMVAENNRESGRVVSASLSPDVAESYAMGILDAVRVARSRTRV